MIAQAVLSLLLCSVLVYSWAEYRRSPIVALMSGTAALAGLYLVWFPSHSTRVAELIGIGRGADLDSLYVGLHQPYNPPESSFEASHPARIDHRFGADDCACQCRFSK